MRYTVITREVHVLGRIWQGCVATYTYTLPPCIKTRKQVADWLKSNAGDFESITDFSASIDRKEIPFSLPDSEAIYLESVS